jgi:serine/threonine protein kinase
MQDFQAVPATEFSEPDNQYSNYKSQASSPQFRYQPGDRIAGRYEVSQCLMGGMGEVYLCFDLIERVPYALKTFKRSDLAEDFTREVSTWVALQKHPNIVRCFRLEVLDDMQFMFLEWVASDRLERTDLHAWLRTGPLTLRQALDFAIDIVRGLIHASKVQPVMVHRDLKPDNILIAQGDIAKLTDFGLAKVIKKVAPLPQGQYAAGTPLYMSPEQWQGQPVDWRTDLYAVGCILYEMLTGKPPFSMATNLVELRRLHLEEPPPNLPESLPAELNQLVKCCLAKAPADRFASPQKLLTELTGIYAQLFETEPRPEAAADKFNEVDYVNRGLTYYRLKQPKLALSDYSNAIKLNSNYVLAYINRATVYAYQQDFQAAMKDYRAALKLDQDNATSYLLYGNNRAAMEHLMRQAEESLNNKESPRENAPILALLHFHRGLEFLRQKSGLLQREAPYYEEALKEFDEAIRLYPGYAPAYLVRGSSHFNLKRKRKATEDFEKAYTLDPINTMAYLESGNVAWLDNSQFLGETLKPKSVSIKDSTGYLIFFVIITIMILTLILLDPAKFLLMLVLSSVVGAVLGVGGFQGRIGFRADALQRSLPYLAKVLKRHDPKLVGFTTRTRRNIWRKLIVAAFLVGISSAAVKELGPKRVESPIPTPSLYSNYGSNNYSGSYQSWYTPEASSSLYWTAAANSSLYWTADASSIVTAIPYSSYISSSYEYTPTPAYLTSTPTASSTTSSKIPTGWSEFYSAEGRFKVLFPTTPTKSNQPFNYEGGSTTVYTFSVEQSNKATYGVWYMEYSVTPAEVDSNKLFQNITDSIEKGLLQSLTSSGVKGAALTSTKNISLDNYPGKEYKVSFQGGNMYIRMYLVKNRLYQIAAIYQGSSFEPDEIQAFLASFKLVADQ